MMFYSEHLKIENFMKMRKIFIDPKLYKHNFWEIIKAVKCMRENKILSFVICFRTRYFIAEIIKNIFNLKAKSAIINLNTKNLLIVLI
jgi:CTP synthase (UTP-ammonia lyase)